MRLKISNILPSTRIAVFRGSGKSRNYEDEDIVFHDFCLYQKSFDLPEGEYAIRTIHKDLMFEHIDVTLSKDKDSTVWIKNTIDPTSVNSYENYKQFVNEFQNFSEKYMIETKVDLNEEDPITEKIQTDLNENWENLKLKYYI